MEIGTVGTRQEELRKQLRAHYEEILQDYGLLFERKTGRPPAQWPALIEYRITGGVAYYYNEEQTAVLPLEFPKALESVQDQIVAHLGPESWEKWEDLVRDTSSHLEAVVGLWKVILEDVATAAHNIGLFPYERLSERPLDIYWPSMFLNAIWGDVGYYEGNKAHLWERTKVVEETTAIPMRHTTDVVQTWVFSGVPWILTQSRDAAEMMKKAWEDEAVKIEPRVWDLLEERNRIEDTTRELLTTLHRSEVEYGGYHKDLPNACSKCKPWLDELERLGSLAPAD